MFKFETYTQEAHAFVNKVALALGTDDPSQASRVITAFFHALRDRISTEESLHFISQLPFFLKAVYVDGWKLSPKNIRAGNLEEFINTIRLRCGYTAIKDLGNDLNAERTLRQLISVIREYVDQGELDDIIAQLPDEIGDLFERTVV